MSFIALEISINGERLHTAGSENWRSLWAHVLGHRFTPDFFTPETMPPGEEMPKDDVIRIDFRLSVSVPSDDRNDLSEPSSETPHQQVTGKYQGRQLKVGDVITITVIETDAADEPEWQKPDPRFPGPTIVPSDTDPA